MAFPQNSVRWRVGQKWFHCDLSTGCLISSASFWGGVFLARCRLSFCDLLIVLSTVSLDGSQRMFDISEDCGIQRRNYISGARTRRKPLSR